jgi:hypothetical protein
LLVCHTVRVEEALSFTSGTFSNRVRVSLFIGRHLRLFGRRFGVFTSLNPLLGIFVLKLLFGLLRLLEFSRHEFRSIRGYCGVAAGKFIILSVKLVVVLLFLSRHLVFTIGKLG